MLIRIGKWLFEVELIFQFFAQTARRVPARALLACMCYLFCGFSVHDGSSLAMNLHELICKSKKIEGLYRKKLIL